MWGSGSARTIPIANLARRAKFNQGGAGDPVRFLHRLLCVWCLRTYEKLMQGNTVVHPRLVISDVKKS